MSNPHRYDALIARARDVGIDAGAMDAILSAANSDSVVRAWLFRLDDSPINPPSLSMVLAQCVIHLVSVNRDLRDHVTALIESKPIAHFVPISEKR